MDKTRMLTPNPNGKWNVQINLANFPINSHHYLHTCAIAKSSNTLLSKNDYCVTKNNNLKPIDMVINHHKYDLIQILKVEN